MRVDLTDLRDAGLIGLSTGLVAFLLEMSARFIYLYYWTDEQSPVGYPAFLIYYTVAGLLVGLAVPPLRETTKSVRRSPRVIVRIAAGALALAVTTAVIVLVAIKLGLGLRAVIRHLGIAVIVWASLAAVGWTLVRLKDRYGTLRFLTGLGILCLSLVGGHNAFLRANTLARLHRRVPDPAFETDRPNILLLTIDTLRADRLGAYAYHKNNSNNIDRLAREGILFEKTIAHSPWTRASFGSIMTSTYPSQHGAFKVLDPAPGPSEKPKPALYDGVIRDDALTMAEILRRHGYRNFAFQANWWASGAHKFDRGFDVFLVRRSLIAPRMEERSLGGHYGGRILRLFGWLPERPFYTAADAVYRSFKSFSSDRLPQPFFIWINFFDTHPPYQVRDKSSADDEEQVSAYYDFKDTEVPTATLSAAYDEEVRFVDHYLGKVVDLLRDQGLLDHTIVIFTSDHGEEFDDHLAEIRYPRLTIRGRFHGHSLYGELLNVPLIIRYPLRVPPGSRVETLVRHVDLVPTVLELAAIDPGDAGERFEGRSLVPMIRGTDGAGLRPAYSERNLFGRQLRSVQHGRYKLIVELGSDRIELYDVSADPEELVNLAESRKDEAGRLMALLGEWGARMGPALPPSPEVSAQSAEDLERLRALGYVE